MIFPYREGHRPGPIRPGPTAAISGLAVRLAGVAQRLQDGALGHGHPRAAAGDGISLRAARDGRKARDGEGVVHEDGGRMVWDERWGGVDVFGRVGV